MKRVLQALREPLSQNPTKPRAAVWWPRLEVLAALLATILIVVVHWVLMRHAGPLWRDEINSLQVATMPTWRELWSFLWTDSFPILPFAVMRFWSALGLAGQDAGWRVLGFLVGFSIIAVLWRNARILGYASPSVALILFGFNAVTIRYGDSLRGYGLGIALLLWCFGLLWQLAIAPTRRAIVVAFAGCLLATHCLYQSAFFLPCLGLATIIVAAREGNWKAVRAVLGIALICAASLAFYYPVVKAYSNFMDYHKTEFDPQSLWFTCSQTLSSPRLWMFWVWMACIFGALLIVLLATTRPFARKPVPAQPLNCDRRILVFALTVLISAPLCYALFLKISSLTTNIWYYLPVLSLVAMSLDAIWGSTFQTRWSHVARAACLLAACSLLFYPSWQKAHIRQTNADLFANLLTRQARSGDFIIVNPWFFGQSFARYYHGPASWMTIPPLAADHGMHQENLLEKRLASREPLRPLLAEIARALRSGHHVWFAGAPAFTDKPAPVLAPTTSGRELDAHAVAWTLQTGYFLYLHSTRHGLLPRTDDPPISPFETFDLAVFSGWRDKPAAIAPR